MNTQFIENNENQNSESEQDLEIITRKYISGDINLEVYRSIVSKLVTLTDDRKVPERYRPILLAFESANDAVAREIALHSAQERMELKIDALIGKVATREDVAEQARQLLEYQQQANKVLQEKIEILRSMQESNVPHKRLAKYAIAFLAFFCFSFLSDVLFGVTVVVNLPKVVPIISRQI